MLGWLAQNHMDWKAQNHVRLDSPKAANYVGWIAPNHAGLENTLTQQLKTLWAG